MQVTSISIPQLRLTWELMIEGNAQLQEVNLAGLQIINQWLAFSDNANLKQVSERSN